MQYHAGEIIRDLIRHKFIKAKDETKAIKALLKEWEDRRIIVWGVEDIIDRAKDTGKKVTKERAQEILDEMIHRHDCNYGITWDTIDFYLD